MTTASRTAYPGWFLVTTRVMGLLQKVGFSPGPVRVLTLPGRRTGAPRSTPVSPVEFEGARYVVAAVPESDWVRNAKASGLGDLARGRQHEPVRLTEVSDLELKRALLRTYPDHVPVGARMMKLVGLVDRTDAEHLAAVADRVAVLRVDPA
ncbi:MAG TPA: nitroreductase/quinone reductase family protein [Dermatophilaceae bacterium]|nr:nitroreductase/quinone reductase family protein [Dermatophilaceae bacterium]